MKKNWKKTLSLFLAILLFFASCPAGSMTAEAAPRKTNKIALNFKSASSYAGGTVKLRVVSVRPKKASKKAIWTSSNQKIATVSSNGKVKAKKAGTVTITARSKSNPAIKAKCKIKVYKATKAMKLFNGKDTLRLGESVTLRAKITKPVKGAQPVRWKSSNQKVAKVSAKGKVTALSCGTAKIFAQSGKVKASAVIKVLKKMPEPGKEPEEERKPDSSDDSAKPDSGNKPDGGKDPGQEETGELTRAEWVALVEEKTGSKTGWEDFPGSPGECATREFAAATSVRALGFVSEEPLKSTDCEALAYPAEDKTAVEIGLLSLKEGAFRPNDVLAADEKAAAIQVIDQIMQGRKTDLEYEDACTYQNPDIMTDWTGLARDYRIVQEAGGASLEAKLVGPVQEADLEKGTVIILPESEAYPAGAFFQVSEIMTDADGMTRISGDVPEISDVYRSIDLEGNAVADLKGAVPEEGVAFSYTEEAIHTALQPRGKARDHSLRVSNQDIGCSLKVTVTDEQIALEAGRFSGESGVVTGDSNLGMVCILNIPNIQYHFDWEFDGCEITKLKEFYLNIPNTISIGAVTGLKAEGQKKICTIPFPLATTGLAIELGLYVTYGVGGKVRLDLKFDGAIGMQYVNGSMQNLIRYGADAGWEAEAEARIGLMPELAISWMKIFRIYSVAAEAGGKFAATTEDHSDQDLICTDIRAWVYLDISMGEKTLIGDLMKLKGSVQIYNEDNSPYRKNPLHHLENGKIVEKCAYKGARVAGKVTDTAGLGVEGCRVTAFSDGKECGQAQTGSDGGFLIRLSGGSYRLLFEKSGYRDVSKEVGLKSDGQKKIDVVLTKSQEEPEDPEILKSGTYCGMHWSIDENYRLTLFGTCEDGDGADWETAPWIEEKENILSVKVAVNGLTYLYRMFRGYSNLKQADFSETSASALVDTSYLFSNCSSLEEARFGNFNTAGVTRMICMFAGCGSLKSLDVSGLDTRNAEYMDHMFDGCASLESLDVSGFDTSNAKSMRCMFAGCGSLTSLDVSGFDTRNARGMEYMFEECVNLKSLDISGFDTSNAVHMEGMFCGCVSLKSLDVSGLDTSNAVYMYGMFSDCVSLESLDVSGLDTSNAVDIGGMFSGCASLKSLDVSGLDTSNAVYIGSMFSGCASLKSLDVSGFDTGNAHGMFEMFRGCVSLESLDVSEFNTGNVENMQGMFSGCASLESLDVSGFDTGSARKLQEMFLGCSKLKSLDVSGFDTGNAESMYQMFGSCSSLTSLNLSSFHTGSVTDMGGMFQGCRSLVSLDIGNFDIAGVRDLDSDIFLGCVSLETVLFPPGWPPDIVPPRASGTDSDAAGARY